ncbi:MAG: phosphoribosylglycinamide formyltransferase [Pseudanabaenaceae cyanobacterium]
MYSVPQLGILASGKGSNLVAIADAIAAGELNAQIAVVIYNNPDAPVRERCQERGIPHVLLNHREFASRELLDDRLAHTLEQYQVDLVVMAGWMRIVTQVLIDRFPHRILNIHPSLLPSFPGHRAVQQALEYGVKITGCTVHIVTLEVDRGPILAQVPVPVLPGDTVETLHQRIQQAEHKIYPKTIGAYLQRLRQLNE